jgi:ubiquinone/menaquinone biosynthesis C-methylase UbiE
VERFSRETWIQHDICSRHPWPFPNKAFDFVTCSHMREDIRDPTWVCKEMMRVAKRGYLEVPSIDAELSRGVESRHRAGYQHHHWIIEMDDDRLVFQLKLHFLMGRWRFHLPTTFGAALSDQQRVQ